MLWCSPLNIGTIDQVIIKHGDAGINHGLKTVGLVNQEGAVRGEPRLVLACSLPMDYGKKVIATDSCLLTSALLATCTCTMQWRLDRCYWKRCFSEQTFKSQFPIGLWNETLQNVYASLSAWQTGSVIPQTLPHAVEGSGRQQANNPCSTTQSPLVSFPCRPRTRATVYGTVHVGALIMHPF